LHSITRVVRLATRFTGLLAIAAAVARIRVHLRSRIVGKIFVFTRFTLPSSQGNGLVIFLDAWPFDAAFFRVIVRFLQRSVLQLLSLRSSDEPGCCFPRSGVFGIA
jgi:hypothetical protein